LLILVITGFRLGLFASFATFASFACLARIAWALFIQMLQLCLAL